MSDKARNAWLIIMSAAVIFMITMGARQSLGLFVAPLHLSTGLSIVSVSFTFAVSQLVWGLAQPIFGAIADRKGAYPVLVAGAVLLSAGLALTPLASTEWSLILTLGMLTAAGAGAGSFSILIGAAVRQIPQGYGALAGGFINAGGSFGQFVFAPLLQAMISTWGWVTAIMATAVTALLTIPAASCLRGKAAVAGGATASSLSPGVFQQVRQALCKPSYLWLHAGFFTCGFHVAFLVTHLPGEVSLCGFTAGVSAASLALIGLFNVAGSLLAGWLGSRFKMKHILAVLYGSRAVMIAFYLFFPKTPGLFYIFSAGIGFTWLATVPPTAGIVGKLFGPRYLGTLFGLTFMTHQIGGFLGAWLGGIAISYSGSYLWMWYGDIALAAAAAMVNLLIHEPGPEEKSYFENAR